MKLKEKDSEIGYLYLTSANQYRAVLAIKGDFMIYAPSLEGTEPFTTILPFENQPFKKCQIVNFAKKDYREFEFNGSYKASVLLTFLMIMTRKGSLMASVFLGSSGHVMKLVLTFVPMISRTDEAMSGSVMRLICPLRTFWSQI